MIKVFNRWQCPSNLDLVSDTLKRSQPASAAAAFSDQSSNKEKPLSHSSSTSDISRNFSLRQIARTIFLFSKNVQERFFASHKSIWFDGQKNGGRRIGRILELSNWTNFHFPTKKWLVLIIWIRDTQYSILNFTKYLNLAWLEPNLGIFMSANLNRLVYLVKPRRRSTMKFQVKAPRTAFLAANPGLNYQTLPEQTDLLVPK